jgi:formylglycine-generating enzyme required for sulfatase activity
MLLALRADGTPWCFVDATPVAARDYALAMTRGKKRRAPGSGPVTRVSYDQAQRYAKAKQKRLARADEWRAASKVAGFGSAGMWEWVDDGAPGRQKRRIVVRATGAKLLDKRKSAGSKDITFRLALDL